MYGDSNWKSIEIEQKNKSNSNNNDNGLKQKSVDIFFESWPKRKSHMNHKDRMSHPSDPKLTALALNLRKGIKLNINTIAKWTEQEIANNNKLINQ